MLYILFRFVIIIPILILLFCLRRKKYLAKIALYIILSIFVVLCIFLFMFPLENLFFSFETPNEAFDYIATGNIEGIEYGNQSCLIYYRTKENNYSYMFVEKTPKGYKLLSSYSFTKIADRFDSKGKFTVYKVKGTNDYYIIGTTVGYENIVITDSNNKVIPNIVLGSKTTNTYATNIYSYISDYSDEYYLLVNGEEIHIGSQGNG